MEGSWLFVWLHLGNALPTFLWRMHMFCTIVCAAVSDLSFIVHDSDARGDRLLSTQICTFFNQHFSLITWLEIILQCTSHLFDFFLSTLLAQIFMNLHRHLEAILCKRNLILILFHFQLSSLYPLYLCAIHCANSVVIENVELCNAKFLDSSGSSHSDNNLVELGNEMIKEDDRAVLLEGGLTKSASTKFNTSSIKANLIR